MNLLLSCQAQETSFIRDWLSSLETLCGLFFSLIKHKSSDSDPSVKRGLPLVSAERERRTTFLAATTSSHYSTWHVNCKLSTDMLGGVLSLIPLCKEVPGNPSVT